MPDTFNIPFDSSRFLPKELGQEFFDSLNETLKRQESRQIEDVLGNLQDRGFLRSGTTLRDISEQVLGPGQQRRREALLPLLERGAFAGREERLGDVGFSRQKELGDIGFSRQKELGDIAFKRQEQQRKEDFAFRLEELQRQADIKRSLLELQARLERQNEPGFLDILGKGFGEALGGGLGGGVTGALGGIGRELASGLFSRRNPQRDIFSEDIFG